MTWSKDSSIIGIQSCTQFLNSGADQLNPQTAYQTSTFITDNTTTAQTITFASFDSFTLTDSVNTKLLTATASSGLTVTLTSLNTNIATISGFTLTALTAGTVSIQATQAGNGTYNMAVPVICTITIALEKSQTGPSENIATPIQITTNTQKSGVKSVIINIDNIRYTQYSGISYGFATGFRGAALLATISALDYNNNPLTDFSDYPLNVTFNMANANPAHTYIMYKRSGSTLIDPQPTGYPVAVTYVSGTNWTASMTSLSDIVVIDNNPPSGNAGGDPYIISIKKVKTLLPNEWRKVSLLDTNTVSIIANCDFLDNDVISNLHYISKSKQECIKIDPMCHKWVKDLTYIKTLEVIRKNDSKKIVIDTINSIILYDNSPFLYETIDSKYGLFSITHAGYYPKANFKKYILHFNEGYLVIAIDNYWDDINHIELFLHEHNDQFTGELIAHNKNNCITLMQLTQ